MQLCLTLLQVPVHRRSRCNAVAETDDRVACLKSFLADQGAGEQSIDLQPTEVYGQDSTIDISVAKTDLKPGALSFVLSTVSLAHEMVEDFLSHRTQPTHSLLVQGTLRCASLTSLS